MWRPCRAPGGGVSLAPIPAMRPRAVRDISSCACRGRIVPASPDGADDRADVGRRREQRQQRSPKRLRRRRAGRARVRRREHACERNADDDIVARRRGLAWSATRRRWWRRGSRRARCASCIAATAACGHAPTRATIDHERRRRRVPSGSRIRGRRTCREPASIAARPGNRRRARTSDSRTPPGPGSRRRGALRGRRSQPGRRGMPSGGRSPLSSPPATRPQLAANRQVDGPLGEDAVE